MPSWKGMLVVLILIVVAFGAGYGLGYMEWQQAAKGWAAAQKDMQSQINGLQKELDQARTREALREIPENLSQAITHLEEKNFGLALKTLEEIKERFQKIQASLGGEMKGKLEFFLPALEEGRKEAEALGADARKKIEEMKNLFDQALKPPRKG